MSRFNIRTVRVMLAFVVMFAVCSCEHRNDVTVNGAGRLEVTIDTNDAPLTVESSYSLTLTDPISGVQHRWESAAEFPQGESFVAGDYRLEASFGSVRDEGFDLPCYRAEEKVTIRQGETTMVTLVPVQESASVDVSFDDTLIDAFPDAELLVQAYGGKVVSFDRAELRTAYLMPETLMVLMRLPSVGGVTLMVSEGVESGRAAEHHLYAVYDASTETITVTDNDMPISQPIEVSAEALAKGVPTVGTVADVVEFVEYDEPAERIAFTIAGGALKRGILMIDSPQLSALGCPSMIDVLAVDGNVRRWLDTQGLPEIVIRDGVLDLTFLSRILVSTGESTLLTFTALGESGLVGGPATIEVKVLPNEFEIEAPEVYAGATTAKVRIKGLDRESASRVRFETLSLNQAAGGELLEVKNFEYDAAGVAEYILGIAGGEEDFNVRVLLDERSIGAFGIRIVEPEFSIEIDPYATRVDVNVVIPPSVDPDHHDWIMRNLRFAVNGSEAVVYNIDPSNDVITLIGLKPDTSYELTAGVLSSGSDAPVKGSFRTERAAELKNGDFEDLLNPFGYENMPCGGTYSLTVAPIFNNQHTRSVTIEEPEGWATVNAKTFCLTSRNINTWYVNPSTMAVKGESASGDISVRLVSTAFDPDGMTIEPYMQLQQPYLTYSPVVPEIRYRAAGKLFLGSYSYDPWSGEERYGEGVEFASRPTSLNGFYRYQPSPNNTEDRGKVVVEVWGEDASGESVLVAAHTTLLGAAAQFTAFSVPLTYSRFGVKAKRVKVMIASSEATGDIAYETENVSTVANPQEGVQEGSELTVDNLSFAY